MTDDNNLSLFSSFLPLCAEVKQTAAILQSDGEPEPLFQVAVETNQGYLFQFALWRWDQKAWNPKCSLHISICVWFNTIRHPFTSFASLLFIYSRTYLACSLCSTGLRMLYGVQALMRLNRIELCGLLLSGQAFIGCKGILQVPLLLQPPRPHEASA